MKAIIFLKHNPTPIEVDITEIETRRGGDNNDIVEMNWKTPNDYEAKLHTIKLDEIAAIVVKEA